MTDAGDGEQYRGDANAQRGDRPRFLGRRLGYGETVVLAADELEAVDEGEQRRQTDEAHLRWKREQQRHWGQARGQISKAVNDFDASYGDRRLSSPLRQVERAAEIVAQRIERLD